MKVAYPEPHGIRRNYTLYPLLPAGFPSPSDEPPLDPTLLINTTFTSEVVASIVTSFIGNYSAFQATLENWGGPHPGPHTILGGDMGGACPFGSGPPACNPGPKWSPNGGKDPSCLRTFTDWHMPFFTQILCFSFTMRFVLPQVSLGQWLTSLSCR